MSDRVPLDHLTSDALDQLYAECDRLTAELGDYDQRVEQLEELLSIAHDTSNKSEAARARAVQRADQAEAAVARVRAECERLHAVSVLAALEPAPAATQATGHAYLSTGCLHGNLALPDGRTGHQYCQSDTGRAGAKTPAQCKFCAAPCQCPCHTTTKET